MVSGKTTLERAFELAKSGPCTNVKELREQMKREGYTSSQLVGPALIRQLRGLLSERTQSQSDPQEV